MLAYLTFDITVQLALAVKIVEALEDFPKDDRYVHLLEASGLHQVQCRAPAQVLHDDP